MKMSVNVVSMILALHHGESNRDVAGNGYIQSCNRFHRLKCSVLLGCSLENKLHCGYPGGCHGNVACYQPIKPANSRYIDVCDHSPIRLPKMQDQKSLSLHWCSFSEWSRVCVTFSFASEGSLYLVYEHLHRIATQITQGARPKIIDSPLTLTFRMGQGAVLTGFWL
jgi:hypothetical protein